MRQLEIVMFEMHLFAVSYHKSRAAPATVLLPEKMQFTTFTREVGCIDTNVLSDMLSAIVQFASDTLDLPSQLKMPPGTMLLANRQFVAQRPVFIRTAEALPALCPLNCKFSPGAMYTPFVKFTNRQLTDGPPYTFTGPTISQFSSSFTCRTLQSDAEEPTLLLITHPTAPPALMPVPIPLRLLRTTQFVMYVKYAPPPCLFPELG